MNATKRFSITAVVLLANATALILLIAITYRAEQRRSTTLRIDPLRPPTAFEAVLTYPIDHARNAHERNDVLFIGDSTCRHGIDPQLFQELTGLTAHNLGTIAGAGPDVPYLIVKCYLDNHPAPRVVVICITPLAFGPPFDDREGALSRRFADGFGSTPTAAGALETGARAICAAVTGNSEGVIDLPLVRDTAETLRTLQVRLRESRGFWALQASHDAPWVVPGKGERIAVVEDWEPALTDLAELCAKSGTQLLIRITPMRDNIARVRDFREFDRWMVGVGSRHPELTVCRPALLWYDSEKCWDHIHLNAHGVEAFMPVVAKDVLAALTK